MIFSVTHVDWFYNTSYVGVECRISLRRPRRIDGANCVPARPEWFFFLFFWFRKDASFWEREKIETVACSSGLVGLQGRSLWHRLRQLIIQDGLRITSSHRRSPTIAPLTSGLWWDLQPRLTYALDILHATEGVLWVIYTFIEINVSQVEMYIASLKVSSYLAQIRLNFHTLY